MDYPIVSFISNSPIVTCMGTQVSFKKLITKIRVSTPSWDIHKSQLASPIVVDARLGITCRSMFFMTMASNIPFTKEDQDGKTTQGCWLKTNLQSQMFSQLEKNL